MPEIPPEARQAIEEFKREEAARQAARMSREQGKKGKPGGGVELKTATADALIRLAQANGWELETGGRHPKLVKGKRRVAIPVHGGSGRNLATGTLQAILKIIKVY